MLGDGSWGNKTSDLAIAGSVTQSQLVGQTLLVAGLTPLQAPVFQKKSFPDAICSRQVWFPGAVHELLHMPGEHL